MSNLRARLRERPLVVAPGCYDALSALMIERAGFAAAYLSGASVAYTRLGQPDIGLVSFSELADTVGLIRDRVALPLIVDADTGFGNALNVQRTVRVLSRQGANALQLEDQAMPKRCGHLRDKTLVSTAEMVGKLHAALDARPGEQTLIIARTDAIAVEGFAAACDRAEAYLEAGADVLFIEAPTSMAELETIGHRFGARVPLLANMVEGGTTPLSDAAALEAFGFALAIFPGGTVRAVTRALDEYLASLATHGTTAPFRERMLDFRGINEVIGTEALLKTGAGYG